MTMLQQTSFFPSISTIESSRINTVELFFQPYIFQKYFFTKYGLMVEDDCISVLKNIKSETVDTVFADPPFNLNKMYGKKSNDNLENEEYIEWSKSWIREAIRIINPGGSLFIYNLPKWNMLLGSFLYENGMMFRHWIAVNIKLCLPIPKKLYPSHYSLLYFTKGKPKTFHKIRTPIELCRHCGKEIKDYGGHRNAMNPKGVNLTDVWNDIPPVRHKKFKHEKRVENQLSTKLLERVIRMSTNKNDLVVDPFGGGGTTFAVCEKLHRRWIGSEIESIEPIQERLQSGLGWHKNDDFVEEDA